MDTTFAEAKAGDTLYATYTWDDTRIPHFYQVISKAAKSLVVQEVISRKTAPSDGWQMCEVVPGRQKIGHPFRVRLNKWGWLDARLSKWGSPMHVWHGTPIYNSFM